MYITEIYTFTDECIHDRDRRRLCWLPPSTPRTSNKRSALKRARKRQSEGTRERKTRGKERRKDRRKGGEKKEDSSEGRRSMCAWPFCRVLVAEARVCSVFRMYGTSAACPRPPELWSLCAHPAWCSPACLLPASCLSTYLPTYLFGSTDCPLLLHPSTFTAAILHLTEPVGFSSLR